jgi:hypothetical protein
MIRDFFHWLWHGRPHEVETLAAVCAFCARGKHVHDVNSGRCITRWCDCQEAS